MYGIDYNALSFALLALGMLGFVALLICNNKQERDAYARASAFRKERELIHREKERARREIERERMRMCRAHHADVHRFGV